MFIVALGVYVIYSVLSMSMWLYTPANVFARLSGLEFTISISISGAIVIFYTAFGGMRAIVWTDIVQLLIVILSTLSVIVRGAVLLGGLAQVSKIVQGSNQKSFDYDPNPFTEKATCW